MIVLSCTLPLAFVIVSLAMGKGLKKGLLMAVSFGLGLSVTLSIYGLFVAIIGSVANGWRDGECGGDFWEHGGWNRVVEFVTGEDSQIAEIGDHDEPLGTPEEHGHEAIVSEEKHRHNTPDYIPAPGSWITLLLLIVIPLGWYRYKNKRVETVGINK